VEGMDLSHCAMNKKGSEPAAAFLQNTGACAIWEDGHEWRALRDKQFTYAIYRVDGQELLFDNINDPNQTKNLAKDPQYSEYLTKFQKILKEKMHAINDTFEASTWYRDNWIKNRVIIRTATID
jgi:arylsulfatase A-like enzyme